MLKLGTVFSEIGAIEHALDRMGIDYFIEFACDNSDVNIFNKEIDIDFLEIEKEIKYLKNYVPTNDMNSRCSINWCKYTKVWYVKRKSTIY